MGFWSWLFGFRENVSPARASLKPANQEALPSDAEFDKLMRSWDDKMEKYRLPDLIVVNVNGKPPYHWADSHKHDLDMMLACANAELQACEQSGGYQAPAPYFAERVAILARKQKRHELEVQTCEALLNALTHWRERILERGLRPGKDIADVAAGPRVGSIKSRLPKARELLVKGGKK